MIYPTDFTNAYVEINGFALPPSLCTGNIAYTMMTKTLTKADILGASISTSFIQEEIRLTLPSKQSDSVYPSLLDSKLL